MRMSYQSTGYLPVLVLGLLAGCGGGGGGGDDDPPANRTPSANAGADQSAFKAGAVTLDGSASTDPDGNALTYRWVQTAGASVTLSSATTARPTFTAPAASGTLTFSLVVNDGRADSAADTAQVTISNRAPTANAGADSSIDSSTLYTLSALGSTDPDTDPLTYTWVQLTGPQVVLTTIAPGRARFTAPAATTRLEFGVIANDGEVASGQDTVTIDVTQRTSNEPPVVWVDGDSSAPKRYETTIWSYGYDPEGAPVTFSWTQVEGPTVTLAEASNYYLTFTTPAQAAALTFEVVVSDGVTASEPVRVTVTVQNFEPQVIDAAITPDSPDTLDAISVAGTFSDPDSDPLTISYAWKRNGVPVPAVTGDTFPANLTTRDDEIVATISASDGTATTSIDVSTVIVDSPPTLTASPPTVVNYGDNVAFQVTAGSDADGDPIPPFVLKLAPAGFSVSPTGAVTWQAALPMFDDYVDVAWSIGLRDTPTAELSGTLRVNHAARQMPFMRSGQTVPQNREELVVTDLNADGKADILVSDGRSLGTLALSGAEYLQDWAYPFNLAGEENGISAITAGNTTGDARQEIFVVSDGRIRELDGATRKQIHEYTEDGLENCLTLRVADLEGDGSKELVCLGTETSYYYNDGAKRIVILNAADLSFKARITQTGLGSSMAVGNVDADAALEIVTGNGYVFDGATRLNEWAYGPQFGQLVETGDVDGDGIDEIVASGYTAPKIFSAVTHSPIGEITQGSPYGLSAVHVADVDNDGRDEVILGEAQWGSVTVWRLNTVSHLFDLVASVNSQDHGVAAIATGNVDADADLEIVWGVGYTSSGEDVMVVGQFSSPSTLAIEWSSATTGDIDGPFFGGMLAHTAASTSRLMFVSPTTRSGYGGAQLFALDAANGDVSYSSEVGSNYSHASGLDVADTDADGIDEVFLSSSNGYDPFYATYDFATDAREWTSPTGYSASMAIQHADFSGDGRPDFATIGGDGRVTIFNVAQSNIVWQSTQLVGSAADIGVADLDHDGQQDVIALTSGFLYVYGRASPSVTFLERANLPVTNAFKLLVADSDGDGEYELFVLSTGYYGSGPTEMRVYDRNLQLLRTAFLTQSVRNMILEPGTSPRKNLLVSVAPPNSGYYWSTSSEIWAIDPVSGAGVWRSPQLPGEFSRNSLNAVDVVGDTQYELSFGTTVGAFVTR